MKKEIYILGSIIGFFAFALSMYFVEYSSIFGMAGMFGIWGMMYCYSKLLDNKE